jgi:hypothetical protein
MPLFQSSGGKPPTILAKDRERVFIYQLTAAGAKRLRENGARHGRSVPGRVLASLIRTGEAHSPSAADAAGQKTLFDDDTSDHLPRCELTGATTDLHLVVYGEGNGVVAKLVSTEPRFLLQKGTTVSVPLAALTAAMVDTLESTGKLPAGSAAVKTLRQWFRRDFEAAWTKLAAERREPQISLGLEPTGDELPLASPGK